jgi:hypothetical protein
MLMQQACPIQQSIGMKLSPSSGPEMRLRKRNPEPRKNAHTFASIKEFSSNRYEFYM